MPSSCRQKQTSDVLWCCCGGHQPFFDKHHQLPKQKAGRVVASDPLPSGGERSLLQDSLKVGNRGWKCWMENWGYALKKNLSNIGAGLCSRKGKKNQKPTPKTKPLCMCHWYFFWVLPWQSFNLLVNAEVSWDSSAFVQPGCSPAVCAERGHTDRCCFGKKPQVLSKIRWLCSCPS